MCVSLTVQGKDLSGSAFMERHRNQAGRRWVCPEFPLPLLHPVKASRPLSGDNGVDGVGWDGMGCFVGCDVVCVLPCRGFSLHAGDRHQVFKPSSVQSMW